MIFRNNTSLATFLITFLFVSCTDNNQTATGKIYFYDTVALSNEERMQRQVWLHFKEVVTSIDLNAFRQLSLSCIYCPDCNAYLTKSDSSGTKNNVLINEFIDKGGFASVFNRTANEFYFNDTNVASIQIVDSLNTDLDGCQSASTVNAQKAFEVTIKDDKCAGSECSQTIFTFVEIEDGYKFFSMLNVP